MTNREAHRRAGGRRAYNLDRQEAAKRRQDTIMDLTKVLPLFQRGVKAALAKQWGVSRATITRDMQATLKRFYKHSCPT